MEKPVGYDDTPAKQGGVFENPEAGGYVLGIVNAEMSKTKEAQKNMLILSLDIAEGKFKNFYRELSLKLEKDCYLKNYLVCEGDNVPFFKGAITSIEHSNTGFKFNFDEKTLVKKLVGANLREEEYINGKGETKTILKIAYMCGVDTVKKGVPVLSVKALSGSNTKTKQPDPTSTYDCPF
jgi:hypothetical protein